MAGKRSQWVMVFCVNDVVHHYRTGRQGVVTGWERGHTHMWILFDDGEEKPRRKAAFNKGEWWRTGKVRLTTGTGETRLVEVSMVQQWWQDKCGFRPEWWIVEKEW